MSGSPAACSGAIYAGVPMLVPICVSVAPPDEVRAALMAFAMPKSVTTATPPEMSTLSGLMSRCTTPRWCAYASAFDTSRRMPITSGTASGPRERRERSDSPSTKGIV